MIFKEWMAAQTNRDDDIGRLAALQIPIPEHTPDRAYWMRAMRAFFKGKAPDGVNDTAKAAWLEWEASRKEGSADAPPE
jgi:hypothetical protein